MQLNNNCTMYLREISNVLAIACIIRKENTINQVSDTNLVIFNVNSLGFGDFCKADDSEFHCECYIHCTSVHARNMDA